MSPQESKINHLLDKGGVVTSSVMVRMPDGSRAWVDDFARVEWDHRWSSKSVGAEIGRGDFVNASAQFYNKGRVWQERSTNIKNALLVGYDHIEVGGHFKMVAVVAPENAGKSNVYVPVESLSLVKESACPQ